MSRYRHIRARWRRLTPAVLATFVWSACVSPVLAAFASGRTGVGAGRARRHWLIGYLRHAWIRVCDHFGELAMIGRRHALPVHCGARPSARNGWHRLRCNVAAGIGVVALLVAGLPRMAAGQSGGHGGPIKVAMACDRFLQPFPTVMCSINGRQPMPFAISTAQTLAVTIEPWAAPLLGLSVATLSGAPARDVPIASVRIGGDQVHPGVSVYNTFADISPMGDQQVFGNRRPGGSIGMPILGRISWCLDPGAGMATFYRPGESPQTSPGGHLKDLEVDPLLIGGIEPAEGGPPRKVWISTGTPYTGMAWSEAQRFGAIARIRMAETGPAKAACLVPAIRVGGAILRQVVSMDRDEPPVMGWDVLSRFRMDYDAPRKQLSLAPRSDLSVYHGVYGSVGVTTIDDGPYLQVLSVEPKGPAGRSGVEVGDRIARVDGIALGALSATMRQYLLSGIAYSDAALQLLKLGGKRVTVTLPRGCAFSTATAYEPDDLGIIFVTGPPDRYYVTGVAPGSPAFRAGVLLGDLLISCDGKPAASMKQTDWQLRKPVHRAVVRSPGGSNRTVVMRRGPS